ncbi:MAG TPA: hypothetical protein VGI21_11930 [Streptosporangiaceae bacterium]|jgi:hypothetical protein
MRLRLLAAVSALAVTTTAGLTACGGGGPAATSLASKLGCGNVTQAPQNSTAQQDIDCDMPGGVAVEIVTFGSTSDLTTWVHSQAAATCCVTGKDWAATVTLGYSGSASPYFQKIVHALGGRQVTSAS